MIIENALVMAGVTFVGGYLIWKKIPVRVREWLQRQSLLTDLGLFYVGYLVMGGTVTALLAAAILGVIVSAALYVANHPEECRWIDEMIESAKSALKELMPTA